ncbi:hypothetical protein SBRCBS47491_004172 [Sporothrix bragantina]|uniref:Vacuolar ATPase assembly protein VMA22 n=1 Tax=Sporothrix bragantina TaxID=671064 RepID=A0ABP0BLC7_9PEZI
MSSELIDELLAHYLGLLHEYTELRSLLSAHQVSMFGHLARANFAAERGFRYGPDHFDGRMQALVRLEIAEDSNGAEKSATFAVVRPKKEVLAASPEKDDKEGNDGEVDATAEKQTEKQTEIKTEKKNEKKTAKDKKKDKGPRDPLQWFGVLTPMALRQAQQEAITAIDTLVPRLATVSAEMAAVEIEVRRARKKRARAAAAQDKEDKSTSATTTKTEKRVSV